MLLFSIYLLIGLIIVKKIIQKHKGFISFESVLGKGSIVKILFPKKILILFLKTNIIYNY